MRFVKKMRKTNSGSVTENSAQASTEKTNSWISSSFTGVATTCCYSVDDSQDSDYYLPASSSKPGNSPDTIDAELGLTEDHFSCPEGYFGLSTIEELEMAIENCEEMIRRTPEKTEKQKQLIKKLVQLRYMYQEIKDCPDEIPQGTVILGHLFETGSSDRLQQYCEKCCGNIWGVVHNWWQCKHCGLCCHNKCINLIMRTCAITKVIENPQYILDICPEKCLSDQKYRCAECKRKFVFKDNESLPRLCEYNGMSYCANCHWNTAAIIPARVVHNWDFVPRKVCRASVQFLRLMMRKPCLNIDSLNPALYGFVSELRTIKRLREEILVMKQYFVTCHTASEEKLLLHLRDRQHFVESSAVYSLQDLIDTISGQLVVYLEKVRTTFIEHITQSCQGCRGKGFICEFCQSEEVLYPFYPQIETCSECNSLFHKECYQRFEGQCRKCDRRTKLKEKCSDEETEET